MIRRNKTTRGLDQRTKVLLSEGSSTSSRQTLYALGDAYRIDVLDPARLTLCRFSRYVNHWFRSPSSSRTPLDYLRFLAQKLREQRYDVLLPTHEQAYLLARVRDAVGEHVGLALPPFEAIDRMQDKAKFLGLLVELNLPHPETTIVTARSQLQKLWDYPCYLKLAHGTAGSTVIQVHNQQQMQQAADRMDREGTLREHGEILVQQPARGSLSVIQAVFQHGRLVGSHCTRALVQGVGGAPVSRISVSDSSVVEDVRRMGELLQWHGPLFVEYFYDEATGGVQYLEANPRIGETLNATLCGVNLCEQVIRVSLDKPVEPARLGKTGVRTHQGMTRLLAAACQGGTRRRILGEIACNWASRDLYKNSQDELARPRDDWPSIFPFLGVAAQLLLAPKLADRIVRQAVDNYSLPGAAAAEIREYYQTVLDQAMGESASNELAESSW